MTFAIVDTNVWVIKSWEESILGKIFSLLGFPSIIKTIDEQLPYGKLKHAGKRTEMNKLTFLNARTQTARETKNGRTNERTQL